MLLELPIVTFADLAALGLEVKVYCRSCHRSTRFDPVDPRLRDRRFVGARFRCTTVRRLWNASPPQPCGGTGHVHIAPAADRLIRPGQSVLHAEIHCPRCVPTWQIDQAPRHEAPWQEMFDRGARIRCPACRWSLTTIWHGHSGMPFTDSFQATLADALTSAGR
jgi:hypothetical protein